MTSVRVQVPSSLVHRARIRPWRRQSYEWMWNTGGSRTGPPYSFRYTGHPSSTVPMASNWPCLKTRQSRGPSFPCQFLSRLAQSRHTKPGTGW